LPPPIFPNRLADVVIAERSEWYIEIGEPSLTTVTFRAKASRFSPPPIWRGRGRRFFFGLPYLENRGITGGVVAEHKPLYCNGFTLFLGLGLVES
jgi:hypothetical protein